MRRNPTWAFAVLMLGAIAAAPPSRAAIGRPAAPRPPAVQAAEQGIPALRLDVTVRDGQGRPVADLEASQFTVTVDGTARRVLSARHVFRGPGSEASARAAAQRPSAGGAAQLFEPSRVILVVVDEMSFPRGAEKAIVSAADRLLDRFGPSDHVAVVTAPMLGDARSLAFGDDRATIRETLARVQGRAVLPQILARPDDAAVPPVVDPDSAAGAGSAGAGTETPPAKVAEESRREQATDQPLPPGERAEHPVETLARLVSGLRVAPGPKTIVFATAGLPDADPATAAAVRAHLQRVEAEASRSRATLYVLALPGAGQAVSWTEFEQLAAATGGEMVRVGRTPDQALDRIGLAVSAAYSLEVEGAASDRDARGVAIKVAAGRGGATVRAARRVVARNDPPFLAVAPAPAAAIGARDFPDPAAEPARETKGRRHEPDPDLDAIVARASEYLFGYFRDFKNVVAEEDYTQMNMAVSPATTRRTRSDFLLATAPDGKTLVPFRDVFEVDGRAVRDREDRLRKLFLEAPSGDALDAAARVQNEGARYNLVSTRTTVNVPTFPLTFLVEPFIQGFQFRRGREETIEGVRVLRVDFTEVGSPTMVYAATDNADVPSAGSFWIEPLTGRIVKTYMRAARTPSADPQSSMSLEATVTYRRSDALGLWVPVEMRETYRLRGYSTEGRASYSNFRSFQVRTQQEIKTDKK